MARRGTPNILQSRVIALLMLLISAGCADFDLNRLNPVRYVAGGRTYSPVAKLIAQGQTLANQIQKRNSDKGERERARSEAASARQRMGDDRVRQMKRSNTKMAVRVNDQDGYMIVDPDSGKPVNKTVYTVPPESRSRVASTDSYSGGSSESNRPPESIRRPDEPVPADNGRPVGNLDDYNVVFAN